MYVYIKQYYDEGLYTKADIATFVQAGWITPTEYKQITGDDYPVQ